MDLLNEENDGFEDDWERQGATYEQTLMALKNNIKYEPDRYYKHNYSKNRKNKKEKHKKHPKRIKKSNNFKKIEASYGKPILNLASSSSSVLDDKLSHKLSDESYDSDTSITSNGSGTGSISSILTNIEGVPSKEWILSRLRAIRDVFMLSWPIFVTSELLALLYFINLLWIGHRYNAEQLAGASLACNLINIIGQAFIIGMSSSLDTLCGQAFGAQSFNMVGIFLQRMIIIIHIVIIIIAIIFLYSQEILIKYLYQSRDVAIWSGKFTKTFIIALYPLSMWYCLRRYLQSQGKVKIIFPSVIFAIIGQWIGLYIFDIYLNIGFISTAISLATAYWFQFISMLILIFLSKTHLKTWPGWKLNQLFKGWKQIFYLSIPSLCMLCSEWWAFEIQSIFAGWINNDSLAAFALSLNFLTMIIKIPLSISWSNGIIVANKLGKMRADEASAAWDASLILSTFMTGLIASFCWFGREIISYLYAPQEIHKKIRENMENCLQILAIYIMIDQIQRCGQGAIRGMGMQKIGAYTNIFSYYCIGIPIGLYLCFKQHWNVSGLWIGMCSASIVSSIVFIILRFKVNWREQIKRTFQRIQEKQKKLQQFKDNDAEKLNKYMLHDSDNEDNYEDDENVYNSINSIPEHRSE